MRMRTIMYNMQWQPTSARTNQYACRHTPCAYVRTHLMRARAWRDVRVLNVVRRASSVTTRCTPHVRRSVLMHFRNFFIGQFYPNGSTVQSPSWDLIPDSGWALLSFLLDFKIQDNRLILLSRARKRASHKTERRNTKKEIKGIIKTTLHAQRTLQKSRENIIEPTHE